MNTKLWDELNDQQSEELLGGGAPSEPPGSIISDIARNSGHSGNYNPGNAKSPFVPFVLGTNKNEPPEALQP